MLVACNVITDRCASIICVPAIGADPRRTWDREVDGAGFEHERLDDVLHEKLCPDAQIHLYDHLTREERALEIRPPEIVGDEAHRQSTIAFAAAEDRLSEYVVADWADRFLEYVTEYRREQDTHHRPIFFICHSTGGIVVKHALSRKSADHIDDLAAVCLGVTFFSTPHHGSRVLSEPEFGRTVKDQLELKWELSSSLRDDFTLRNQELEKLNYKFAVGVVGAKIYNFVETVDTPLLVLSANDSTGETLTTVHQCIVDSRSGKLGTAEVPIEDEEFIQLRTTHAGAPRFVGEDTLYGLYLNEIIDFVKAFRAEERAAYHKLDHDIMTGVEVDVHQFYEVKAQGQSRSIKILTARPSLRNFLDLGPSKCMGDRITGINSTEPPQSNGSIRPSIEVRPASESKAPRLMITRTDTDDAIKNAKNAATATPRLSAPAVTPPKNIHTRRPSVVLEPEETLSPGHLMPKPSKTVQFRDSLDTMDSQIQDPDQKRRPQRAHLFPLPSATSGRFKWIHVPFNHSGWVPHVLTTISQEKEDLSLHSKVLMDKIWFSLHNRSRHGAPHAHFVRPSVRCLLPQTSERANSEGMLSPTSASEGTQMVIYLPYLHWDSFRGLQRRASVINRRKQQTRARPIAKDIALGRSLEHKLIWQHLTSDRPVHCRRTLDQYGYPSLRNTSVRDADQILYKRTKAGNDALPPKESKLKHKNRSTARRQSVVAGTFNDPRDRASSGDEIAKVLMVDQMWLWIIDHQTVVTFFSPKEKEDNDDGLWREGDLRSAIYQDINGDYANQCADPFDFAALAVFHAIRALLEGATDPNLQVFRIFEEYISILTERQTASFKHFRNNHMFERAKDTHAQSHIDNRKDLDALLELRDIEDELNTIDKLLKEQQTCVQDMITNYAHLNTAHKIGLNGTNFLLEIQVFLAEHKEALDSMLKGAVAAQRAFKDLLDMKQKQANIVEAHFAREQNEVAADQSRSVMIFTIFTIIFLPLSFFASVFGIQSKEWSGGNYPKLHTIFTYMGSISLAVIIIALLVAFNKFTRRITQRFWKAVAMPFLAALQRFGIMRFPATTSTATYAAPGDAMAFGGAAKGMGMNVDLEKAAAAEGDLERKKRLSTISRSFTRMNWEEELRLHRESVVGL